MVWKLFSEKVTSFELEQHDIRIRSTIATEHNSIWIELDSLNKRLGELYERDFNSDIARSEDIQRLKSAHEHMGSVAVQRTEAIQALTARVSQIESKGTPADLSALQARLEALELRLAQFLDVITEQNPVTGKKKLTGMGNKLKKFYGRG